MPRVRAREADPLDAADAVHCFEQAGEVAGGIVGRAIVVHDLSEQLDFAPPGAPVIVEISRVSKPGRRVYSSIKDLKPVKNGLGISILSTPKGVMSDTSARDANVGGEVLCRVY